jgi:hypothetical protein
VTPVLLDRVPDPAVQKGATRDLPHQTGDSRRDGIA